MKILGAVRRILGDVGLVVIGLLLGAGLFSSWQAVTSSAAETVPEAIVLRAPEPGGSGAATPAEAVQAVLDADPNDDASSVLQFLSAADRLGRSPSQPILGSIGRWAWLDADELITTVELEPGLSVTNGWTPSSTTIFWSVVDEDGWRVSLSDSVSIADLPSDEAAVAAAHAWLGDPERCASQPSSVHLTSPSSWFEQLCAAGGVLAAESVRPIDAVAAADLSLAYGPDASRWARTVSVEGGLDLILAALGDEWIVIDAAAT